jgi:hypothetical protein
VQRLAAEAARGLQAPETARAMTAAGFEVLGTPPAGLRELVAAEIGRWGPLIGRLGIRPES